jgi:chromosome segregation ATPase
MKRLGWLIIFISLLPLSQVEAQLEKVPDLKSDTTDVDKKIITRDLINARDSLNNLLAQLANQSEKSEATPLSRRALNQSIAQLSYHKGEIDKVIEEVASLKTKRWDSGIRERSIRVVRDVRKNIRKTREDAKDLAMANS